MSKLIDITDSMEYHSIMRYFCEDILLEILRESDCIAEGVEMQKKVASAAISIKTIVDNHISKRDEEFNAEYAKGLLAGVCIESGLLEDPDPDILEPGALTLEDVVFGAIENPEEELEQIKSVMREVSESDEKENNE